MSLILHIDTAVEGASFCIAEAKQLLAFEQNKAIKDSAGWLHAAIHTTFHKKGISLQQLSAIAVSAGPGSYTGLRVGMATAKGLCYALQIPLMALDTLQIMAEAAMAASIATDLLCPMIDARRMEVFTAIFDKQGQPIWPAQNLILDQDSFSTLLENHTITFFGNGSIKWKELAAHKHAFVVNIEHSALHMLNLAYSSYQLKSFTDLAYSEPLYVKEFFTTQIPQSIQKKC